MACNFLQNVHKYCKVHCSFSASESNSGSLVWFSLDLERWGYKQSQEETNHSNLVTVVFDFQQVGRSLNTLTLTPIATPLLLKISVRPSSYVVL